MGEEAVDRGAEEDGGCVAAGGYVGGCPCCEGPRWDCQFCSCWEGVYHGYIGGWRGIESLPGRDGLVFGLGFQEAGEEIPRIGRGLLAERIVRRTFSFCNTREPKFDDWVHADVL